MFKKAKDILSQVRKYTSTKKDSDFKILIGFITFISLTSSWLSFSSRKKNIYKNQK